MSILAYGNFHGVQSGGNIWYTNTDIPDGGSGYYMRGGPHAS